MRRDLRAFFGKLWTRIEAPVLELTAHFTRPVQGPEGIVVMSALHADVRRTSAWQIFLQKLRSAFLWLGLPLIALIVLPIILVLVRDGF